ncbi:MAG: alpha/beta hydrolase, partial [Variovorax sp.]
HRLDVFTPSGAVSGDVLVFVHGGAFVRGDKTVREALYDNVCRWFARQGVIAVNVEYRLAGDAPFPGGSDDVGAAVHWLAQHVGTLGGDASRIFLMGHSAGGTHVASYCCEPLLADAFAQGPVAGAVLVSARLRADVLPDNPNAFAVRAYYGDDAQAHEAHSPVTHARAFRVPALVAIAQYENPHLDVYGAEMMAGLLGGPLRHAHRFVQLMRHNHLSIVAHFDTGEERLGREVLDFMASVGAAA